MMEPAHTISLKSCAVLVAVLEEGVSPYPEIQMLGERGLRGCIKRMREIQSENPMIILLCSSCIKNSWRNHWDTNLMSYSIPTIVTERISFAAIIDYPV